MMGESNSNLIMDDEIESILYIGREVSVFKIPPLKKNEGHRAGEWGDLAAPALERTTPDYREVVWCIADVRGPTDWRTCDGSFVLSSALKHFLVFAKADYDIARPCVEAVLDSSRYFVVRVEDDGRKAYLGMGFQERSDSFDFNVALQDYTKRRRIELNPPEDDTPAPSPHVPAGPKKDYSLKEGQTFSINIPGRANKATTTGTGTNLLGDLAGLSSSTSSNSSSSSGTSSGGFPLLPPPPSSGRKRT
ncbi:hypothetical protein C8F01DRAFT_8215 [Mycena amicta]|nr:hypothetical protein C8F01DRAFT_8215 [Mycena amicta]